MTAHTATQAVRAELADPAFHAFARLGVGFGRASILCAGARTVTSALHGLVRDDGRTRNELLATALSESSACRRPERTDSCPPHPRL